MKDELCEKVVDVGRVSDRVMAVVLVSQQGVLRLICRYVLQSGRSLKKNYLFMISYNASGMSIVLVI